MSCWPKQAWPRSLTHVGGGQGSLSGMECFCRAPQIPKLKR